MPNLLTTQAGLKLGPIVIETFFKHYLERKLETNNADGSARSTTLRDQDLLWQESFEIIRSFLKQATRHTVEELQEFSNARIPVPPWIWVDRVLVPMSICDTAAEYLIKALGGEDLTKRVVGGTKWWQVRGMHGVDCQWICQKSHMRKSQKHDRAKRHDINASKHWRGSRSTKADDNREPSADNDQTDDLNQTEKEAVHQTLSGMDGTRCMLYAHGGGYYFGSIDQERYCMQRYARKINGRVFAVNYRLAPQYPFPCAIQDLLAAYLYLIRPPPEAMHAPVPPHLIVLGGDSAGGGLCLATLQVIRDSGIPLPSSAVLISPWCDLTHSFPSTIQNTKTDIIPPYGLCLHKPSVLWPPPPDEITSVVRAGLRARFKKAALKAVNVENFVSPKGNIRPLQADDITEGEVEVDKAFKDSKANETTDVSQHTPSKGLSYAESHVFGSPDGSPVDVVDSDSKRLASDPVVRVGRPPLPWESRDFDLIVDGETFAIDKQIQLYCPNSLLTHPLVSPALGYLGGLPPLLVIASDKEVLRDEIVYLAHKAAHPDQFPINEDSKSLYLPLQNLSKPYTPTVVHLQVYDDTAHVLPLFSFITPAKYCYRAIALFIKRFASDPPEPEHIIPTAPHTLTPESEGLSKYLTEANSHNSSDVSVPLPPSPSGAATPSMLRSRSFLFRRRSPSPAQRPQRPEEREESVDDTTDLPRGDSGDSGDIAGNRFKSDENQPQGPGTAGDPSVYNGHQWPWAGNMIRERVSIHGVLRPLEPETELPAFGVQPDDLGRINQEVARRYMIGQNLWAKKFGKTAKKIETQRKKNLELAKAETKRTVKNMAQLQEHLFGEHDAVEPKAQTSALSAPQRAKNSFRAKPDLGRHNWVWTWALDDEHPPSSSIVSRRDTAEARHLARVADLCVEQEESKMSGNMLWSVLVNFLTTKPSRQEKEDEDGGEDADDKEVEDNNDVVNLHFSEHDDSNRSKGSRLFERIRTFGRSPRQPDSTGIL